MKSTSNQAQWIRNDRGKSKRFIRRRERSPEDRAILLSGISAELRGDVEALLARDATASDPATSLTQTMAASVSVVTVLGPYKIEDPLGQGGMGQVDIPILIQAKAEYGKLQ